MWLLLAMIGYAGTPDEVAFQNFSGRYVLADTQAALQQELDRSLKSTLDGMSMFMRPFAQKPLKNALKYCTGYTFALTDQEVSLVCEGGNDSIERPLGSQGGTILGEDGETYKVYVLFEGGNMKMKFVSEKTTATYQYIVSGDRLRVVKTVQSVHLKTPLTWTTNYRRS